MFLLLVSVTDVSLQTQNLAKLTWNNPYNPAERTKIFWWLSWQPSKSGKTDQKTPSIAEGTIQVQLNFNSQIHFFVRATEPIMSLKFKPIESTNECTSEIKQ